MDRSIIGPKNSSILYITTTQTNSCVHVSIDQFHAVLFRFFPMSEFDATFETHIQSFHSVNIKLVQHAFLFSQAHFANVHVCGGKLRNNLN